MAKLVDSTDGGEKTVDTKNSPKAQEAKSTVPTSKLSLSKNRSTVEKK